MCGTTRLLLALAVLGCGTACTGRTAPVFSPAVTPTVQLYPGGPSSSFSFEYVGSGLPRGGTENTVDLYAADAPELPAGLEWLNTPRSLLLTQLRGKLVLLHFWDYGCIDCFYNFPDLERLQREYAPYLVVIGVHSAELAGEDQVKALRREVERHGVTHPVVHDPRQRTWYDWGVAGAPTLVLIDPAGSLAHMHVGPGAYRAFRPLIGALVESFGARGGLDDTPLEWAMEWDGVPDPWL